MMMKHMGKTKIFTEMGKCDGDRVVGAGLETRLFVSVYAGGLEIVWKRITVMRN